MSLSASSRGVVARVIVLGWGTASLLLTIAHSLTAEDALREILIGYTIPVLVATGVVAAGVWLHRRRTSAREFWRIGRWCTLGILAMLVFEAASIVYQTAEGTGVAEPQYVLLHAGTAGAFSGVLLGVYDVRARRRTRQLRNERESAARLSQELLVLQRVFRHDIRAAVTVIRGHAEVLRDDDERVRETIIRSATDLERLADKARRIESVAIDLLLRVNAEESRHGISGRV